MAVFHKQKSCLYFFMFYLSIFPIYLCAEITGLWQNRGRFVEFSADGGLRIVLKEYYGFVFTPVLTARWSISSGAGSTFYTPNELNDHGTTILGPPAHAEVWVSYPEERVAQRIPVLVIADSLWLHFYHREVPTATSTTATSTTATSTTDISASAGSPLEGFWLPGGDRPDILIHSSDSPDDFFALYFTATSYARIRYWKTDARERDIAAHFTIAGSPATVPKFIRVAGELYTCIKGGGTILRNFEKGRYTFQNGVLSLKAEPGLQSFPQHSASPLVLTLAPDRSAFGVGDPTYRRLPASANLDFLIAEHNARRRPPRPPLVEFMDLDFRWDEVERIRNQGRSGNSKN